MNTVWKFPFFGGPGDTIVISMPEGAEIVRLAMQDNRPTMWALVDDRALRVDRCFTLIGTGSKVQPGARYLGTVDDGPYVWHGFEVTVTTEPR